MRIGDNAMERRMEDIILSKDDAKRLMSNLKKPDESYIAKRNELFADADKNLIIQDEVDGFRVDIPNLDLSEIFNSREVSATVEKDGDNEYFYTINSHLNASAELKVGYELSWRRGSLETNGHYLYDCNCSGQEGETEILINSNYGIAA